jgi:hypothetical protein
MIAMAKCGQRELSHKTSRPKDCELTGGSEARRAPAQVVLIVEYSALTKWTTRIFPGAGELTAYRMRADRKRKICPAIDPACSSRAKCPESTK